MGGHMSVTVKTLQADNGDSILISFMDGGVTRNILIDCGPASAYKKADSDLRKVINLLKNNGEQIDLLVITHIDDDHIAGALCMIADRKFPVSIINKIWFNSGAKIAKLFDDKCNGIRDLRLPNDGIAQISVGQGRFLEKRIQELKLEDPTVIKSGMELTIGNARILILSPNEESLKKLNDKWEVEKEGVTPLRPRGNDNKMTIKELAERKFEEDSSVPNGSSIAFLLEVGGRSFLLLADAHPSVIETALRELGYSEDNKLKIDAIKVAHHGSRRNSNSELYGILDCTHYLISTDGKRHGFPDKEALARIISTNTNKSVLHFNYEIESMKNMFTPEDFETYNFECKYNDTIDFQLSLE
jgi:beta-lactamase superfamily II metal-dependent hydrolase